MAERELIKEVNFETLLTIEEPFSTATDFWMQHHNELDWKKQLAQTRPNDYLWMGRHFEGFGEFIITAIMLSINQALAKHWAGSQPRIGQIVCPHTC